MKGMKKWLSGLLAAVVVLTSVPLGQVEASDAAVPEVQSAAEESELSQIESITVEDVTIIEHAKGGYRRTDRNSGLQWYKYDLYSLRPTYIFTYKDGHQKSKDWLEIDGKNYVPVYSCIGNSNYEDQWEIGEHTAMVETPKGTIPFTVKIVESPIESIFVEDKSIIEYTKGDYRKEQNPETGVRDLEWYEYKIYNLSQTFTVTYKDGHEERNVEFIEFEGQIYRLDCSYEGNVSYENRWEIGTHSVTVGIGEKETTFTIEIVESPIESISVEDVSIVECTHGSYSVDWNNWNLDLEWYEYDIDSLRPTFTVRYKDGRTTTGIDSININGEFYSPSYESNQTCETAWGIGEHTVTARMMGKEATFTVEIVESPIESITVKDVRIAEFANGSYTKDFNPRTGNYDLEWYRYDIDSLKPTFTIRYKDGSVATGKDFVDINGERYSLFYVDNQSYDNQWKVGKHTVTVRLMGKETTFTVEIVDSPIESIVVEDICIQEFVDVRYTTTWKPGTGNLEWYRYDYKPTFTIKYIDGSVVTGNGTININGAWYSPSYTDNQSYENQWGVGKHIVTARIAGMETTFTVEITKFPYTALEVLKMLPVIENENYTVDREGNVIYEIPVFSYKIIKEDGSYITGIYDPDYRTTDVGRILRTFKIKKNVEVTDNGKDNF